MAVRIAVGQFEASASSRENLTTMRSLAQGARAAGASLIVFPEGAMVRTDPNVALSEYAESLSGPFVDSIRLIARDHEVAVVVGMFEAIPENHRAYNTVVVIDRAGDIVGAYRKVHLYDAFGYRESARVERGPGTLLHFELDGNRFGVMTCYDLRFPALASALADVGVDAILLPAAWVQGPLKEDHWQILLRARAVENTVYMVGAGQVGPTLVGRSMVVDPMGVIVAGLSEAEGLLVADLELDRVERVRSWNPSVKNRRVDVYQGWLQARAPRAVASKQGR